VPDYTRPGDDPPVLSEPTTNRDGVPVGQTVFTQLVVLGRNPSDGRIDTVDANDLRPSDFGTFGYASDVAVGIVHIPSGAKCKRIAVLANASATTTILISDGDTIVLPPNVSFDEQIPGTLLGPFDITIGGADPQTYYIAWVG
jgi:hypothetical protein